MKTSFSIEDLHGVFAVPPLARRRDSTRSLDQAQNNLIVRYIKDGGVTRFIYGGNAFLYHVTLAEYEELLEWLAAFDDDLWPIRVLAHRTGAPSIKRSCCAHFTFPA